jgi:hypothetical protein
VRSSPPPPRRWLHYGAVLAIDQRLSAAWTPTAPQPPTFLAGSIAASPAVPRIFTGRSRLGEADGAYLCVIWVMSVLVRGPCGL